ncbi:unnamed protein product [Closterium sp. NIES-64]|nr:unnamed protein product [Closterium sp. NIES-64]
MDVWGPVRVRGQGQERYFLIVVDDYSRYTSVFPLRTKGEAPNVLIPWIRRARLQLSERFHSDFPVLRLHSDRGGEFSSDLLAAYCAEHGIEQSFTLPASPQQNGVAERRIGLVMELNLWPRVSLPETSPTLLWMGEVGDASHFRVWVSRAFVRDSSADKLSSRAVPCVFLGFVPEASGWQFYHATSRRVLPSQDVTFDESVPYYRLFPYRTAPLPPPPLFLAPGAAVADPLPPQGAAPSGVSQVDPVELVEVAVESRPAGGAEPGGAEPGGVEPGGVEPGGVEPGGVEPGGVELEGAELGGVEPRGAELRSPESGGSESGGTRPGSPAPGGALSSEQLRAWYLEYCSLRRGTARAGRTTGTGASDSSPVRELPSREQIREWYERRCTLRSGVPRVTDPAAVGAAAGAEDPGVGAAAGAEDPGVGAAAGAEDPGVGAAAGAEDPGVGAAAGAADPGVGAATGAEDPGVGAAAGAEDVGAGAAAGAADPGAGVPAGSGVAARSSAVLVPLLQQVLGQLSSSFSSSLLSVSSACPAAVGVTVCLLSPWSLCSLHCPTGGLTERREPASRPASLSLVLSRLSALLSLVVESSVSVFLLSQALTGWRFVRPLLHIVSHCRLLLLPLFLLLLTLVAELVDFAPRWRLNYAASLVAGVLSLSVLRPLEGECALGTDVLEDRQEEFECFVAALPHLVSMLVAPEGDPDAPDIPTPRSYAEAMAGPYSSQWQSAMDTEMASWKSTGTYVDEVPPPGANIVSGMWIFQGEAAVRVLRLSFKARYVARGLQSARGS